MHLCIDAAAVISSWRKSLSGEGRHNLVVINTLKHCMTRVDASTCKAVRTRYFHDLRPWPRNTEKRLVPFCALTLAWRVLIISRAASFLHTRSESFFVWTLPSSRIKFMPDMQITVWSQSGHSQVTVRSTVRSQSGLIKTNRKVMFGELKRLNVNMRFLFNVEI